MYKNFIFTIISFILAFIIAYYYSKKINYIFIIYLIITFFIFYTIFLTIDNSSEHFMIKKFKNIETCKYVRENENKESDNEENNSDCIETTIPIEIGGPLIINNQKICTNKSNLT